MIIDYLPDQYQRFAEEAKFRDWQTGLFTQLAAHFNVSFLDLTAITSPAVKVISLGTGAGHTYFAKTVSLRDCPLRTKIYAAGHQALSEYSSLTMRPHLCHEPIEVLPRKFKKYEGGAVHLVVVDLDNTPILSYQESLARLWKELPHYALLLLMDARADLVWG